jgi:hypothetical protein
MIVIEFRLANHDLDHDSSIRVVILLFILFFFFREIEITR